MKTKLIKPLFFHCACAICLSSTLHAQTLLNVKIGQTPQDTSADGAYQETPAAVLGSGNSWWNEYAFVSGTPYQVSVVDSGNNAMPGVTLTVQNSQGVGNLTTSGNPSFLMNKMPYMNPGGIFDISLAGLAANTQYEFVGYASYPGLSLGGSWAVTTGTLNSGTTANSGASADITTGLGVAYSEFLATSDGSGDLVVAESSPTASYEVLSGFQLEAAPAPEPATVSLIAVGVGLMALILRRGHICL